MVVANCLGCVGCSGCLGCSGVVVGGCTGCSGCWGCHGGLISRWHAKKALKRSYYLDGGWGCSCWGACYGTSWLATPWACHGGCYGGYYGIGSAYGPSVIMVPTVWGHRTSGGWGYAPPTIYGAPYGMYGPTPLPDASVPAAPKPKEGDAKPADKEKKEGAAAEGKKVGALLKFVLPADAQLYVDGQLTNQQGSERTFTTPPLEPGQLYYYDVVAEFKVAGQTLTERKRVIVQAGADITETFSQLLAATQRPTIPLASK